VLFDKGVHRSAPAGSRGYPNDSRSALFGSGFAGLGLLRLVLCPTQEEKHFVSFRFSPVSAPECCQRLAVEFVGCDNEYVVWFRLGYVDYPQEPSSCDAPEGDPRTFSTWPIFCRVDQNLFDFLFRDPMLADVRYICSRIDE
jgi:hypothetical protein